MLQYIGVISLYDIFDALAGLALGIYAFLLTGKYRSIAKLDGKKHGTAIAVGQLAVLLIVFYALLLLLNRTFAQWFTGGNANYYGNLTAWLISAALIPSVFKVSPLRTMDVLTIILPFSLFVAKLACIFHGCCFGIELPGSWYFNHYTDRFEFPIQLLEALIALALHFFLLWYQKRNNRVGSVFPVYLILYSATRFITEFLRDDLPNVRGPLDAYQIMSIIYLLNGIVLLLVLEEYGKRIDFLIRSKAGRSGTSE